jgi:DNA-binding NarL/FixJ family response regulator
MDQFRHLASASGADDIREDVPGIRSAEKGSRRQIQSFDTEPLSEKEEKILELIAEGKINREIANTLFLAEGTVKNYVSRIMEKLHANTRTELAVLSKKQSRAEP